jgi:hypothetical protein
MRALREYYPMIGRPGDCNSSNVKSPIYVEGKEHDGVSLKEAATHKSQ